MAWLYLPTECLTASPSARESGEPISASTLPWENPIAPSVTWRGKLLPLPLRSKLWRTAPYLWLLSGMNLDHSTADRGVEQWISSLRATRASRSPLPGNDWGQPTPGISGPMSPGSSGSASPNGCFWKTSPTIYLWDSTRFSDHYRAWATRLRRDCLARRKWGLHTGESDYLPWPTPTATERENDPTATPSPGTLERYARGEIARVRKTRAPTGKRLSWSTPSAHDGRRPGSDDGSTQGRNLKRETENWATPDARDRKADHPDNSPTHSPPLGRQALRDMPIGSGSLPNTPDSPQPYQPNSDNQWATPSQTAEHSTRYQQGGLPLGAQIPLGKRLNPAFVEWLMGFPRNWTLLSSPSRPALTGSAHSGTPKSQYVQHWRSLLSGMLITRGIRWRWPTDATQ